mgnify:CR=1 FL=1
MAHLNFHVEVLADSIRLDNRITTMALTYPRIIHSEFMTHRSHSRNAASSRAIPISRMISDVLESPFVPLHWGANQAGMQARTALGDTESRSCTTLWLLQRSDAIAAVQKLSELGLHKQIANRLLEPWMWITVIATANQAGWDNFFGLRCHEDAEPHINKIACMALDEMSQSAPILLPQGEWHLPLIGFEGDEELSTSDKVKVCVGRCARVSYLTHDGKRDPAKDIALHDQLVASGHWSPFEHAAQASPDASGGNLGLNWLQYRKTFAGESCKTN